MPKLHQDVDNASSPCEDATLCMYVLATTHIVRMWLSEFGVHNDPDTALSESWPGGTSRPGGEGGAPPSPRCGKFLKFASKTAKFHLFGTLASPVQKVRSNGTCALLAPGAVVPGAVVATHSTGYAQVAHASRGCALVTGHDTSTCLMWLDQHTFP